MAKRQVPEINAGTMADIAFLLLIFFLVTTTMDVDTGITRMLPPPVQKNENIKVKERNVLKVLVNSHDMLMVNGKRMDINELKNKVVDFMTVHPNNPNYPEVEEKMIKELGKKMLVSKGIVSLKNDRGTSYKMYISVQDALAAAFNEMRNQTSRNLFGMDYHLLVNKQKIKAVNKIIPIRISEAEPENIEAK
ncbi:MAG TPA: biopolymer transporter ExbD [Bacteroidetes bacterium]|nr:biopolymer transporter ExbD [Bacteroidota bacterium]